MQRGFGVSAMISPTFIGPLALAAEASGYATFWVNDVPGASGLAQLRIAQDSTTSIRLGVGVIPVDRWTAEEIAAEIARLGLDESRLELGIGAGALHSGSLLATRQVGNRLNELSSARVLIGALGQKMVALAGEACDGVILNWLTPNAAAELAPKTRRAAREAGKTDAHVVAYVRTAANPAAQTRLNVESEAYEGYPSYKRHFDRMGVRAVQTTVNGTASEIDAFYGGFEPSVDELVCRAIAATDSLEDYLVVLDAAAPGTEV